MSIHSNTSYHTAIDLLNLENNHPSTSADKRVEAVAFDVLYSQQPIIDKDAEQIRFKLEEHVKTGSQSYTIVTWNDKKYRITVHKDKSRVSYSEGDWKRLGDNLKSKIWDKAHPGEHFSKGTLSLNAKTKKKWNVTLNNPTYTERPIAKKIIKDLKNLFEKELTALDLSPAPNKSKNISSTPPIRKNLSEAAQEKKETLLKKIIEKSKDCVSPFLKLRAKKQTTTDKSEKTSVFKQPKQFLDKTKNHFFPVPREEEFDLTSETTSLFEEISMPRTEDEFDPTSHTTSQFEKISNISETEDEFDLMSDTTSIGGNSEVTDVLDDQGLPYSPKINQK